jgi:hypothetical protein
VRALPLLPEAEPNDAVLRLLAGSDAYTFGREAWAKRIEIDQTWEHLSRSTDHDDAGVALQVQRGTSVPSIER